MKTTLLDFFAAAADGAAIHVGHGLEESRVKLHGIFRLREREFWNRGVKLKLQTLQDNRVKDAAFRTLPAQDAVSQDEFDALRLTINAAVERIKGLEEPHGLARRLFSARPFIAEWRPAAERGQSCRVRRELYGQVFAIPLRFVARLNHARQIGRIVPARLQPRDDFVGRLWSLSQLRPLYAQGKGGVGGCVRLAIGTFGLAETGLDRALPDGGMHGQVMQPKMPGLLLDLALGRIAVLVQRLKIAENTRNLFASNTKFLGIHNDLHPGSVKAGMG